MTRREQWTEPALGAAIALVVLLVAASPIWPVLLELAGGAALLAGALGYSRLGRAQRMTALALVLLGIGAFVGAGAVSGASDWGELLSVNQAILAMLAGVSFVAAATPSVRAAPSRLTGVPAVWRTAAATHLLASVINFSAVSLIGDRLAAGRGLRPLDASVIVRAFGAAAFWSPFWAASAVALAYAPGADPGVVLLGGLMLACLTLGAGIWSLLRSHRGELAGYAGYPLSGSALAIPVLLAALVVGANLLLPQVDLTIDVLLAALVAALVVAGAGGSERLRLLARHARTGLPRMRGEVVLFVAAGVFSVGLRALIDAVGWGIRLESFSATAAWGFVIAAVLMSLLGVHPLVTIAVAAALLPAPIPNPTLFALSAMAAWGAATIAGPLSALNLLMSGRFRVSPWQGVRRNLDYLVAVVLLSLPVFALCEAAIPDVR